MNYDFMPVPLSLCWNGASLQMDFSSGSPLKGSSACLYSCIALILYSGIRVNGVLTISQRITGETLSVMLLALDYCFYWKRYHWEHILYSFVRNGLYLHRHICPFRIGHRSRCPRLNHMFLFVQIPGRGSSVSENLHLLAHFSLEHLVMS